DDGWLRLGLGVVVAVVLHVAAAPLVAMRVLDRSWEALGSATLPADEPAAVEVAVEVEPAMREVAGGGAWDVAVTAVDGPGEATVGRSWGWRATLGNVGDGAWAGELVERAWLSADDTLDAGDVLLAEARRGVALGSGEGVRGATAVGSGWAEAWSGGVGGAYLIVEALPMSADGVGVASDPRPTNNRRALPINVRAEPATPRFGADDAEPLTTVAWIAYDDFRALVAPQSPTVQPAIQSRATPVPDAPPIVEATDPPPSIPAPASPAARPAIVTPNVPRVGTPIAERPEPDRTPIDLPEVAAAPTDAPQLARPAAPTVRPAPPVPGIVTPARPGELSDQEVAALIDARTSPSEPTPEVDPSEFDEDAAARADLDALSEMDAPDPRDVADVADGVAMEGIANAEREDAARVDAATVAPVDRLTGETEPVVREAGEPGPSGLGLNESEEEADAPADEVPDRADAAQASGASDPSPDLRTAQPPTDAPPRPTSAPRQDREAPPTQLRRIDLETPIRPGRVITGPGLEIKTAVPRISGIARFSTLPYGNPRYAVTFDVDGVVIAVDPIRPAGPPNWEAPILNSLYEWRASGSRLDTQETPFTITLTLNLFGRELDDSDDGDERDAGDASSE
ncbi:MAG: hypothetical protein AAF823_14695, partial [Planctomycetota bacterium]